MEVPGAVITSEPARHDEKYSPAGQSPCYPTSENPDMRHPLFVLDQVLGTGATGLADVSVSISTCLSSASVGF